MIIDCISDLHGYYPQLEGGDLLIVAGDLTARDEGDEYNKFCDWLIDQNYKKKIFIGGNHDNLLVDYIPKFHHCPVRNNLETNKPKELFEYLCDNGTEFENLKIWGSPWTKTFPGMNPRCKAFTVDTEEELAEKFALIPDDVDILVTHSPPLGIFDQIENKPYRDKNVGSRSLRNIVLSASRYSKLKLHIFGHIHEHGGKILDLSEIKFINASHVNERYEPVNKPVRVVL
jgi:Icc-related predicted phosphoesterase